MWMNEGSFKKRKKKFGSCWADANDIVGSLRTGEGSFHVGKATGKRQMNSDAERKTQEESRRIFYGFGEKMRDRYL